MQMFQWSSEALKNYANGNIVVCAETVEEARKIARKEYTKYYFENHPIYSNAYDIKDEEDVDDYNRDMEIFLNDINVEPNVVCVLLLPGSC